MTEDIKTVSLILDLSVFGHPILNEEINTITLHRRGRPTTNLERGIQSLRVLRAAWENMKNSKRAKFLVDNLRYDFDKVESVRDMVDRIHDSLDVLTEICLCHSKTTSASVFYQVVAINILLENGNGKFVFFTVSASFK